MRGWCGLLCVFLVIYLHDSSAQLPPRPLNIPGALLVPGARPSLARPRVNSDFGPRPRRPIPNAAPVPIREVRPVVEEEEEEPSSPTSSFDAEVNKLGISALTSAVRQAVSDEEEEPTLRPSPLPFRPERPIPVTRDQIRDRPLDASPRPLPASRPLPVLRQEPRPFPSLPPSRPSPVPRPVIRQERVEEEDDDFPIRQPVRPKARQQISPQAASQQFRPAPQRAPRPQYEGDEDGSRRRKPPVQILRKYRTDNADGSITWGFENEDGTFKEETLGIDCITRGKYGYVDPDGVRRQYSYETGNKCDQQEEQYEEEELLPKIQPKKPLNVGKSVPQFRPQNSQY